MLSCREARRHADERSCCIGCVVLGCRGRFVSVPDDHHAATSNRPKPAVRIVHLTGPVFDSLARGDLAGVTATSPVPLTAYLTGSDRRGLWQRRGRQVAADSGSAAWVTGIIWDRQHLLAVGTAGYHGPPDTSGMVEIGYAVDPAHRRRGYARAALESGPPRSRRHTPSGSRSAPAIRPLIGWHRSTASSRSANSGTTRTGLRSSTRSRRIACSQVSNLRSCRRACADVHSISEQSLTVRRPGRRGRVAASSRSPGPRCRGIPAGPRDRPARSWPRCCRAGGR